MGAGVGRHVEHIQGVAEQLDAIPPGHAFGLERDPLPVRPGRHHPGPGPAAQQLRGAADVIGMVVGLQHRLQIQAPLLEPVAHRLRHRRIHHRRPVAVVEHEHVVVVQHRDQLNRERGRSVGGARGLGGSGGVHR